MKTFPIQYALLSVSDKTGIVEFAQGLHALSITILSTGGTAKKLRDNNIPVTDVSEYTGSPEIMDGRVKTLHPKIHAGLLGRAGIDDSLMQEEAIHPINLVVVNLYPFQQTVEKPDCVLEDAIENIDIGGPTMVRAAAKNYERVTVVVDHHDYARVLDELNTPDKSTSIDTRFALMKKAFTHTAHYDSAIMQYLTSLNDGHAKEYASNIALPFTKIQDLRYGENPHQTAAFYREADETIGTIAGAEQLQGKPLSYNNIADTDAALEAVKLFSVPACVIVKHANPCGIAVADNLTAAYNRAFITDKTSAFGGIIAFNRELDANTAEQIIANQFVEVIIAPSVHKDALTITAQKQNVRVLACGDLSNAYQSQYDYKRVNGGLLVQSMDVHQITKDDLNAVTKRQPTEQEIQDCLFAWKVVKCVKSNAIVYAKDNATIGIGAGQMSRVISAKIAAMKADDAGLSVQGAVMASDAFFPFRDSIDEAAKAGITMIIQPGGSIRDDEVIAAADEHNIAMVFTGIRHFKH